MTIDNLDEYIKYRYHRSEECLDEALILAEKGRWNAVVNRLYYSCFYAVIALLLKNDIETQSHGKLFSKLFDYRQKGDYGDLFDYDEKIARPLIKQVKEFIGEIKRHIY